MSTKNKILLVEDDPNDVKMILMALENCDQHANVVVVPDGQEAINYLYCLEKYKSRRMENPCVVLLDLNTPKISGLEVLKQIKADAQLRLTPVVILTSSRQKSDLVESYKRGANAYVVKSIDFDEFIKTIGLLGHFWGAVNEPPPTLFDEKIDIQGEIKERNDAVDFIVSKR